MIKVYDSGYRGECPIEAGELKTFFNQIRKTEYGLIAFHPRNEGKKTHAQVQTEKMEGLTSGVSDIIIPASPPFICELKRKDRTKSKFPQVEKDFLIACGEKGAWVCLAYGWEQAWLAFNDWKKQL
jgi:hypothetical protein